MPFIIQFQPPSGAGAYNDTLLIASNDTSAARNPWRIAFSGARDTAQYVGTVSTPLVQAAPGDTIIVPVILRSPNPAQGARITLRIHYDPSVLLPLSATGGTIDSIGTGVIVFTSDGSGVADSNGRDTIGRVKFLVALGDSALSPITIDTLQSGGCPVTFSQTNGGIQLTRLCQQGGTRLFLNNGTLTLSQNDPNPFNGETEIVYQTIESGPARLVIRNVLGQPIAVLADNNTTAGRHIVRFDASGLPSGTYYYVLQTPTQTLRRTMIVEK